MNELPRQKLREIIAMYGLAICDEPQRCKSLLLDLCDGKYQAEIRVLFVAQEEQVVSALLNSSSHEHYALLFARLVKHMHENCGFSEDVARWAVEAWAVALRVSPDVLPGQHVNIEDKNMLTVYRSPSQQAAIHSSTTSEVAILAVADRHRGEKYFRSDIGSDYAVKIAVAEVEHLLDQLALKEKEWEEEDVVRVKQRLEELPRSIVARWREKVESHLEETQFFTKEEWKYFDNGKRLPEIKNFMNPYGATLLVALITEKFISFLQLGEGDIVFVKEDGESVRPIEVDKRLLANRQISLSTDTAVQNFQLEFIHPVSNSPALIMLSTDGYAKLFNTAEDFLQVGKDIHKMLREEGGRERFQSDMSGWLNKGTYREPGDDVAVGIICYLPALKRSPATETLEETIPVEKQTKEELQESSVSFAEPSEEALLAEKQIKEESQGGLISFPEAVEESPWDNSTPPSTPQQKVPSPPPLQQVLPSSNPPKASVNRERTAQDADVNPHAFIRNEALSNDQIPSTASEIGAQPIVVSPRSRKGSYKTIAEALQHAPSGSVIHVYSGTYQERLYINKNVSLKAQGEVIIEHLVPCLTIVAQEVSMEGFTIKGQWNGEQEKEQIAAIDLISGISTFAKCNITSRSRKGLRVMGVRSELNLHHCHIYHTMGEGIVFDGVEKSLLEGCAVFDNVSNGIKIVGSGKTGKNGITIKECEIYNNRLSGIFIQEHGVAHLMNRCDVRANQSGISVIEGSEVTIQETDVNNNTNIGIRIGRGIVEARGCQVFNNKNGVAIYQEGIAQVNGCVVRENNGYGIEISGNGRINLDETAVSRNKGIGIRVRRSILAAIESQVIDNEQGGIDIQGPGIGHTLIGCTVRGNKSFGISVSERSSVTVEGGSISARKDQSAMIFRQSTGEVRGCTIESYSSSVVARESTQLSLAECTIHSSSYYLVAEKQSIIIASECEPFQKQRIDKRIYKDETSQVNINNIQQQDGK